LVLDDGGQVSEVLPTKEAKFPKGQGATKERRERIC